MSRCVAVVLFLSFGLVFQLSHGLEVNVTNGGQLCLYANLMLNFSVSYETKDNKTHTATFQLPANASSNSSTCANATSTLTLTFGDGHSWSMNFSLIGNLYQADNITFIYNLSDSNIFPNSASNRTHSVTGKPDITKIVVDTCYSCRSTELIEAQMVNMTLWNVLMQAFVNGSKSETMTVCDPDKTTTSAPPTTHATNATTVAPVTNTTTSAPSTTTPTPAPTPPAPSTGTYMLKSDENSTVCLLAKFGLQIRFKQGNDDQVMNFEPNGTKISGFCDVDSSELVLQSGAMTVNFTFSNDTKKFRLHALTVSVTTSSGDFSQSNNNLSLWEASVGNSYMCNKEQNVTISDLLTLYTFNLQVQPFGVNKAVFSTAEECFLDSDLSFLVPIAVGVALSFLIILVLISYLIGRRKSRTGYQSV